ncbi:MAG: glycoside hydrolase family 95 protein [Clostridiales bacterium]|nr:glycoside hydrolase family 95 protein [Clostridiales bacterium]
MSLRLMERTPAKRFEDAHLLGNGRLGATVYGGVPTEEILINDDTLWSGQERYRLNEGYYEKLLQARALALAGEFKRANDLINDEMEGAWTQAYLPLARLYLTVGQADDRRNMRLRRVLNAGGDADGYERSLDIESAVERVTYRLGGVRYGREVFVSHPAQVICVRLTADGGPLAFAMAIDSPLRHEIAAGGRSVSLKGVAPDHAEPSYTPVVPALVYHEECQSDALRFAARALVADTDGAVTSDGTRVYVAGASYAVILIAAGTNYAGYRVPRDRDAGRVLAALDRQLDEAARAGYAALLKGHLADYRSLYDRVRVDLGQSITDELPTSERLTRCAEGVYDPSLAALAAQYGRYLLISCSRPGTQAANLQGIWNDSASPPWSSNYTTNINVQMNYWPAELFALPECHLPLMDLIGETADSGERTARDYYRAGGWVAHHNIDLWRHTIPCCEDAAWFWWPFGGAWLCQHLWTHYEFTQDIEFLRETAYPVLRGAARFMLDFLVDDGEHLLTAPSTSPENKYIVPGPKGYREIIRDVEPGNRFSPNLPQITAITKGSTMDLTLIRELFDNVRSACHALGEADELIGEIDAALPRLPDYRAGKNGALLEWHDDVEECTPGMDHMSHLYGVYPGNVLNERDRPKAYQAAEASFMRRVLHGGLNRDWPAAWAVCLAARFGNRTMCSQVLRGMTASLSTNLLVRGYVQIDAIFGMAAGVGEMLLQSHLGALELLPTPAHGWTSGQFRGLRGRGGFSVDARWAGGALVEATVRSLAGRDCSIKAQGLVAVVDAAGQTVAAAQENAARFATSAGAEYRLLFS